MKNSILSIAAMALLSGNAIAQQKPNIILFLVDDMGWQDTSLPFWNDTTELNYIYSKLFNNLSTYPSPFMYKFSVPTWSR